MSELHSREDVMDIELFEKDGDLKMMAGKIERFYLIDGSECYRAIYWQEHTHAVAFEVKHAQGYAEDGVSYFQDGQPVTVEEAEVFLRGSIKWDGCSNFYFPGMTHRCDRAGLASIGILLGRIFDQCAAIMLMTNVLLDGDIGQQEVVEDKLPWVVATAPEQQGG